VYWFVTTGVVLLVAIGLWWRQRRREAERARELRQVTDELADADEPLVAVARHFWFPALGAYGESRESAVRMLDVFGAALPADAMRLARLVEDARERIAQTGELDDQRATALRALFDALARRGALDAELRASLVSGQLDWAPEAVDAPDAGLDAGQRQVLRELSDELTNKNSEAVVRAVDECIADEAVQGVYRAALLDCRGRAFLQLGRADDAVRDFEAASRLAPETDVRQLVGGPQSS
jgi:tetratricopeptide (TPR) repeat protein